jgi:hypothetical protein
MSGPIFAIPPRVRRAILDLLDGWGASPQTTVAEIGKHRGFATIGDLSAYLDETYGGEAWAHFGGTLMQFVHELTPEGAPRPDTNAAAALSTVANPALLGLPDDLFLFAAELGRGHVAGFHADLSGGIDPTYHEYQARLSELFLANGIPYELDDEGHFVPSGSPTVFATSVGPAMDALDEPRLATARMHLIEAQRRLQEPDQEEAVDEARQAVEAAMIAVLDACGIPVPEKRQPDELFNALAPKDPDQPRAMSRDALELVLATPRFRGRTAAGHAGGPAVTLGEAQAAVAAASAAILYLADKLPE